MFARVWGNIVVKKKRGIQYHDPPMKFNVGLEKFVVDLPTKPLPGEYQSSDKWLAFVTIGIICFIVALVVWGFISSR